MLSDHQGEAIEWWKRLIPSSMRLLLHHLQSKTEIPTIKVKSLSGEIKRKTHMTEICAEYLERLGATRQRANSAPLPADVGTLATSAGVAALQRLISQPGPSPPPRQASRLPRLSGPPGLPMSMPVPVIKVEKDQFEMSPLPPDFAIDFNDTHKHFGATEPNIKVEQDLDFDQADFDSLEGLIQNYELTHQATVGPTPLQSQQGNEDVKPDINKNKKNFTSTDNTAPTSIPTGICLQVTLLPLL